jgi:hypothetical protein
MIKENLRFLLGNRKSIREKDRAFHLPIMQRDSRAQWPQGRRHAQEGRSNLQALIVTVV